MTLSLASDVLLATWEQAYGLSAVGKGLALLSLAVPHESLATLMGWSLGQRDGALLSLRARLFGEQLTSVVSCPNCTERVQLDFAVESIRLESLPESRSVSAHGSQVLLRAPTSRDLLAIEHCHSHEERRSELVSRCLESQGTPVETGDLDDADFARISDCLAECDPQADVRLALECPTCSHRWTSRFDIVAFLWKELDAWAQRLLAEVHALARAYGWSEREIVVMTPWRRQIYLEMVRQ